MLGRPATLRRVSFTFLVSDVSVKGEIVQLAKLSILQGDHFDRVLNFLARGLADIISTSTSVRSTAIASVGVCSVLALDSSRIFAVSNKAFRAEVVDSLAILSIFI